MLLEELKMKCRTQTEQIMAWKKAYSMQSEQHFREQLEKTDQLNYLTSQLLLLESRLIRKQKQISNILYQRELTIYRQQKIIEALSSRLIDHGIDTALEGTYTDFDSLNDSDSAVVLEDIDSDCNSSIIMKRKSSNNDVTVARSISDAIQMPRRANCYLRRPDILETVYSVEEDPDAQQEQDKAQADVAEKRDKFRNRSDKRITDGVEECSSSEPTSIIVPHHAQTFWEKLTNYHSYTMRYHEDSRRSSEEDSSTPKQNQVTNYNRVMSNHRSVTKPKDVKYKRINKAKSKSLEELRGRLKHWVERGSSYNLQHQQYCLAQQQQIQQQIDYKCEMAAQTYA
ncbi:unnamed protein product [Diamesa hyperborea]